MTIVIIHRDNFILERESEVEVEEEEVLRHPFHTVIYIKRYTKRKSLFMALSWRL
jgi:hypothetical protein